METTIPPRDHGPTTYRYTWDENGEITQVTRVRDSRPFSTARLNPGRQTAQWPFQSIVTTTTDIEPPSSPSPSHHHQHRRATSASAYPSTASTCYHPTQPYPDPQQSISRNPDNIPSEETTPSPNRASLVPIPEYVRTFLRNSTSTINNTTALHPLKQNPVYRPYRPSESQEVEVEETRTATPQHRGVELVVPEEGSNLQHRSRVADFEGFYFDHDDNDGSEAEGSLGRVDSREMENGELERQEEQGFLASSVWDGVPVEFVGEKGVGGGNNRRWMGGWRAGVAVNVLAAFVVLVVGFVCLVVAISPVPLDAGRSAFFVGSFDAARKADWGLRAVISVFVVVLVAGANYAFQVIGSPTREEVMAAHLGREWLDIGVPSFRNIGRIERSRGFLAVVVLVTAVLTQIMYNAVIFVSQTAPNYQAAVVTESFVKGAPFSNGIPSNLGQLSDHDLQTLQRRAARGDLIHLTRPACINQFGGNFVTEYSAVLLVSDSNAAPLIQTFPGTIRDSIPDQSSIQYCLALPAPALTCDVNLNASLLGSVALLNAIALVATAAVLFKRRSSFHPLVTLGDAISSFLQDPDPTTQGACLLSKSDVRHGRWPLQEIQFWAPKTHYWLRSVSFPRWIASFSIWAICVGLTAAGLACSLTSSPQTGSTRLTPFGTGSPHTLLPFLQTTPPAAAAVLASLPQLLLAILYFVTNGLLTTYYLSHDSAQFATGPARPLRVSAEPEGAQTMSLRLTLPVPVSSMLMVWCMGMAFVLSQSFFAVAVRLVDVDVAANVLSSESSGVPVVALGMSWTGLLVLLVMLVLLAVLVVGLGLRRAPGAGGMKGERAGNPMALPGGSCSAVVSARCHPLAREKGLWTKPVMWGVVREGTGFGVSHCGFTAGRAGVVEAGRNYA